MYFYDFSLIYDSVISEIPSFASSAHSFQFSAVAPLCRHSNPQITKTYAKGELSEMYRLMFRSSRFSFYLLFFLSLPVLFETNFILTVWLKNVPENSVVFLRIMICTSLIYSIANPLIIANQATGKVKKYQN